MAKGQVLKKEIIKKILDTFEGSFLYNDDKEIRISGIEDGETVQIKVTLTAAKVNVEPGEDKIIPGAIKENIQSSNELNFNQIKEEPITREVTKEEKENVSKLLASLGL